MFKELQDENILIMEMSTVNEKGVSEVKTEACDRLLAHRVDVKMKTKKVTNILNRLHVAVPAPRDSKVCSPISSNVTEPLFGSLL